MDERHEMKRWDAKHEMDEMSANMNGCNECKHEWNVLRGRKHEWKQTLMKCVGEVEHEWKQILMKCVERSGINENKHEWKQPLMKNKH